MKKKKKKSAKKAAFDIEAFEKELGGAAPASTSKKGGEDAEDDEDGGLGEAEEGDLGEDVFALPNAPVDVGDEQETWHGSDRDYTYQEVSSFAPLLRALH